jgi:RNA polymerase sigma-70 factor (ECF subfamily)
LDKPFASLQQYLYMATAKELSDFLEAVERRAFKQTAYAVRDDHAALDIVQDAMMKLATKYADKPLAELPMLFQRILQNTMRDYWRRQKVRNLWTTLLSSFGGSAEGGDERDPLETIDVEDDSDEPHAQLERSQTIKLIELAIQKLPARQREAFVLRYWEEMDVAETAKIMGCSDGSVKTHCSRAVHSLATELKKQGLDKLGITGSIAMSKRLKS